MKDNSSVKKIKEALTRNIHIMDVAVNLIQRYVVITHTLAFDTSYALNILQGKGMNYEVKIINKEEL